MTVHTLLSSLLGKKYICAPYMFLMYIIRYIIHYIALFLKCFMKKNEKNLVCDLSRLFFRIKYDSI